MASPGSDDGRTPLARPGRDGMAALPHPPPLSLDIRHATPEDFQLREGDDPSPTASSPRSGRRPASAGPETPGALASSAASSASAAIDVRGSLTSLRNRRQSMVPEHLLHARSESPLPDDLQPSDLQARGLRQINFPGSFATQDAFLPKRLLDGSEEGTPLGSRARRRTMIGLSSGSASIDSNHRADHLRESSIDSNRRTNYLREPSIDGMDDDEDGSVFDESRPLLTGTLHSSPKEPFFHDAGPDREGTDFSFPSTTSQRNIPGFAEGNTDIHEMMVEERELRFGIDYDFLATYLADAKEKRDLPPSPKPEVRKRTGSTVPDPRRQRTGSSVFRGLLSPSTEPVVVHHEPPAPAQTVINFYSPGFGAISAPSIGELDFSKYGKTLADVIRDPGGDWFWIDVVNLDAATMRTLARVFSIHPLTCEDILSATETRSGREKCEFFLGYYFVQFRSFVDDETSPDYLEPLTLHYLVGGGNQRTNADGEPDGREPGWILTFHPSDLRHGLNVLRRMDVLKAYGLRITADWISYALVDDVVDRFLPILDTLEWEVDTIDDLVFILKESEQSDMLKRIGEARKRVTTLLRLLTSKNDVIKTLVKRGSNRWIRNGDSEVGVYLGDVQDHVYAAVGNLTHYDNTLTRAHANYLASINLEITISSHRTSDVVMRISTVGAILVPLNIVTGLFGMNVHVPWQHDSPYKPSIAFYVILISMCVWVLMVLIWARLKGYA